MDVETSEDYLNIMRTVDNMMKRRGSLRKDYRAMHETYLVKLIERLHFAEAGIERGLETKYETRRFTLEHEYRQKRMEMTKQKVDFYKRIELLELEISMLREKHQEELRKHSRQLN